MRTSFSLPSIFHRVHQYIPVVGGTLVIDFGSSEIKIGMFYQDTWQVVAIPTVGVVSNQGDIIATGQHARDMQGKIGKELSIVCPIRQGDIASRKVIERILRQGIEQLFQLQKRSPVLSFFRKVICILPADISRVQQHVAEQVVSSIGGLEIVWIPAPLAHGWGVHMLHADKQSGVLIDIGGETTEVAVIAHHDVFISHRIPIGGQHFSAAIFQCCRKELGIELGEQEVEKIKQHLSFPQESQSVNKEEPKSKKKSVVSKKNFVVQVKGRAISSGLPISVALEINQLESAMTTVLNQLLTATHQVLTDIPPDMGDEVIQAGIVVVGGGSLNNALVEVLQQKLGVHIHGEAKDTHTAVEGVHALLKQSNASLFRSFVKN